MPALGAGIHVLLPSGMTKAVDGREKSGHDVDGFRVITGRRRPRIQL
jgi:hypothetical protein